MRFILIIAFLFLQSFGAKAGGADSSGFYLANAVLKDGTKVFGILKKQTFDTLFIEDFNLGGLAVSKSEINIFEKQYLSGMIAVQTTKGGVYMGQWIAINEGLLFIKNKSLGVITIPAQLIVSISSSSAFAIRKGSVWFANPNATRYFFAPSAIPLRKKEGYFQNAYILGNSINVGITNSLTIGGGVVIPFLFYVTPKISFKVADRFYLGSGILFTQSFLSDLGLSAGIAYGLATYGTPEHNFTLGAGYGFARFNNKYSATPGPIATINGMTRVSKRISIVSENWLIPRAGYNREVTQPNQNSNGVVEIVYENKNFYSAALSLGVRFMPGYAASIDFAVVALRTNPGSSDVYLPYLDFVYKF